MEKTVDKTGISFNGMPISEWLKKEDDTQKAREISSLFSNDISGKKRCIKHVGRKLIYEDDGEGPITHYLTDNDVKKEYGMETTGLSGTAKVLTRLVVVGDKGLTVEEAMNDFPTIGKSCAKSTLGCAVRYLPNVVSSRFESPKNGKGKKHKRYFLTKAVTAEKLIENYNKVSAARARKANLKKKKKDDDNTQAVIEKETNIITTDEGFVGAVEDIVHRMVSDVLSEKLSLIYEKLVGIDELVFNKLVYAGASKEALDSEKLKVITYDIHKHVDAINRLVDEGKDYGIWVVYGDDDEGQMLTVNILQNLK